MSRRPDLVEVWGDVVDIGHLRWSAVIGCVLGLPSYLLAALLFGQFTTAALAKAYALLVGLAACLVAGAICARLFPPKRDLVEEPTDAAARDEAIAELVAESGELGSVDDLPEPARRELRDLDIDDLFTERRGGHEPAPVVQAPDPGAVQR